MSIVHCPLSTLSSLHISSSTSVCSSIRKRGWEAWPDPTGLDLMANDRLYEVTLGLPVHTRAIFSNNSRCSPSLLATPAAEHPSSNRITGPYPCSTLCPPGMPSRAAQCTVIAPRANGSTESRLHQSSLFYFKPSGPHHSATRLAGSLELSRALIVLDT